MKRVLLVFVVAACGSSAPFPSDDVAAFDANFDTTLPSDASDVLSTFDANEDAPKFGGGGPFLCNACVCDGTLNLCEHFSGGAANMPVVGSGAGAPMVADAGNFGDASACDYDAGDTTCSPIPVDCLPNPSCACVMQHFSSICTCEIDPSGNGLVVTCNAP